MASFPYHLRRQLQQGQFIIFCRDSITVVYSDIAEERTILDSQPLLLASEKSSVADLIREPVRLLQRGVSTQVAES